MKSPDLSKLKPGQSLTLENNVYRIRENGTLDVGTIRPDDEEILTQQQFKDDCDVNIILEKYMKTGSLTHVRNAKQGVYADLTTLPLDYHEAMQTIVKADNAFLEIPAQIRARFSNDPQQLINFLQNPQNDEEAISLGLKVLNQQPIQQPQQTHTQQTQPTTTQTPYPQTPQS